LHNSESFFRLISFTQIIFKGKHKNLGIRYEYTLPSNSSDEKIYYWKLSDFSLCSKTCNGGQQQRVPVCYKSFEGIVTDELCWTNAENKRPEKVTRQCNQEVCPAYWWIGPWQPCPVTCQKNGELIFNLEPQIPNHDDSQTKHINR